MKKNVLRLLLLSFIALVGFACGDEKIEEVTISLENENYTLPKEGTLQVKLRSSEPIAGQLTVPFTVAGTAVKDKDYSISANSFVFSAGQKEAVVTITAKGTYDPNKTITITLGTIQDTKYKLLKNIAKIKLEAKDELTYSFTSRKYALTAGLDVELNLLKADGSRYIATEDITIDVEVDTEKTTAVEGTNFSFENGKTITVKKGESKGVVKLTFKTKEVDKDVIVLKVKEREGLVAGQYASTKISVMGSIVAQIMGTWCLKEIHNLDWLKNSMVADITNAPQVSDKDTIIFNNEGNFINKIKGGLKGYFPGDSEFTDKGERKEYFQEDATTGRPPVENIAVLSMTNINVYFDTEKSNVREALVGFNVKEIEGKQVLVMTIYDFEPQKGKFLYDVYEVLKDMAGEGETAMQTSPVRIYFSKVE